MISVLLPVFNSEKYLKECIESILDQTYEDFELVIVDDGSIDNSGKIIEEYANKDPRIVFLRKENEKSISKTRNFLLKHIRGEYFIFIDSDDIIDENFLKILLDTMIKNKSDIVSCSFSIVKIPFLAKKMYGKKDYHSSEALEQMLFAGKFYPVWNKLIKTEIIGDVRFDEEINFGEDLIFFFNLLKKDIKFTFIKNQLYYYRIHPNSLTTSSFDDSKKDFLEKLIAISDDEKYSNIRDIIKVWIYCTARLYRLLTNTKKKEFKEYRFHLKEIIKKYQPFYKKNKQYRPLFKVVMSFLRLF